MRMNPARRSVNAWMSLQPHTIGDDQTLLAARERMHHWQVRHLPVLHGGHLVGVVSERDIAMVEALGGDLGRLRVEEAMTADPWVVEGDAPLAEVAAAMAERRIGTAIVVEDGDRVLGLFTTTDALRALSTFAE
jgi:acetoin utilization protein AcuB